MHTAPGLTGKLILRNGDKTVLAVEPGKVFYRMHKEGIMPACLNQTPHDGMRIPVTTVS